MPARELTAHLRHTVHICSIPHELIRTFDRGHYKMSKYFKTGNIVLRSLASCQTAALLVSYSGIYLMFCCRLCHDASRYNL